MHSHPSLYSFAEPKLHKQSMQHRHDYPQGLQKYAHLCFVATCLSPLPARLARSPARPLASISHAHPCQQNGALCSLSSCSWWLSRPDIVTAAGLTALTCEQSERSGGCSHDGSKGWEMFSSRAVSEVSILPECVQEMGGTVDKKAVCNMKPGQTHWHVPEFLRNLYKRGKLPFPLHLPKEWISQLSSVFSYALKWESGQKFYLEVALSVLF